jgi:hypothetical protein
MIFVPIFFKLTIASCLLLQIDFITGQQLDLASDPWLIIEAFEDPQTDEPVFFRPNPRLICPYLISAYSRALKTFKTSASSASSVCFEGLLDL